MLAIELIAAAQGLDFREHAVGSGTRAAHGAVHRVVAHLDEDRPRFPDHNAMKTAVEDCEVLAEVEKEVGVLRSSWCPGRDADGVVHVEPCAGASLQLSEVKVARERPRRNHMVKAGTLLFATLFSISIVSAASPFELRPRVGGGLNPDGMVIGAQATFASGLLYLAPSVDVTRAEGSTATAYNVDLLLGPLEIPKTSLGLYGGIGHTFLSFKGSVFEGNTVVLGGYLREHFYTEARFGLDMAPDLRVLVGYRLRPPE